LPGRGLNTEKDSMQLIAHRGVHQDHPENTLGAFEASVALGVSHVETDLRLTADRQVVLFHDRHVGDRSVESLTRAELTQVIGYSVPTLVEALEAFPQIHWLLELKTSEVLAPTVSILEQFVGSHHLMLISFLHTVILEAAKQIEIDLGFSLGNSTIGFLDAAAVARARHPRIRAIVWNYEFLNAEMLRRAQADLWHNFVFNTACTDEDSHCMALKVDGLITDRPHVIPSLCDPPSA